MNKELYQEGAFVLMKKLFINQFTTAFLCGFSQIMLQRNIATGLLFVLAIGISSPIMLFGASVSVFFALVVAQFFHYKSDDINNGIYGFNAALTGIAIYLFLPADLISLKLAAFAGAMSTLTMYLMLHFISHFPLIKLSNIPIYTSPFIILTWLLLLLINVTGIDTAPISVTEFSHNYFHIIMRGLGQVMFQEYWLAGVIIFVGLLVNSYKSAIWAVVGSISGLVFARLLYFPDELVLQGAYCFNASLAAIALAERFNRKIWLIFIGVFFSILLTNVFMLFNIPTLTAPFVMACWLVILLNKISVTAKKQTIKYS